MLANTVILSAFISSAAVVAIPSSFKRDDPSDFPKCRDDCFNTISSFTACNSDRDPDKCRCDVQSSTDIQTFKCSFDCLDKTGSKKPFSYFRLNGPAAGVVNANTTMCDSASSPPPKSGTMASQFNLPSCATGCMTAENIPTCKDSLTDPKCVCGSIDNAASPDVSAFSMTKCVLDTCNEQDAAVAIIQLGVDCGDWTPSLNASQFQYPLNKLKKTFDANPPSGSAPSNGGATSSSNTSSSTGASPTDPSKKNSASTLTIGRLSLAVGALMLGLPLL